MTVQFATITADPLKLDKRSDFNAANPTTYTVQIANPCNTENPVLLLDVSGTFSYNYAYIPAWERYYFVSEPTYLNGHQFTVSGTCDVLTSNADEIKNLQINATRSNQKNRLLVDNLRPSQTNRQCENLLLFDCDIDSSGADDIRYILTVQGGAHL